VGEANQAVVGTLTLITKEIAIDSIQVIGVHFAPETTPLASGSYTARLTLVGGGSSTTSTFSWPFSVAAPEQSQPEQRLYLPVVLR
jgi:hypothetical protein